MNPSVYNKYWLLGEFCLFLSSHQGTEVLSSDNLGLKVLRILLFLTHRTPTLRIWHHGDPSPHPSLVNVV